MVYLKRRCAIKFANVLVILSYEIYFVYKKQAYVRIRVVFLLQVEGRQSEAEPVQWPLRNTHEPQLTCAANQLCD